MLGLSWLLLLPIPWVLSPLLFAGFLWLQQPPYSVTLHVLDILLLRHKGQEDFGKVRLFGSLSYGLTVALFGLWMAKESYKSAGQWAVWLYLGLLGATALTALTLPRDKKETWPSNDIQTSQATPEKFSMWALFRVPGLLMFLLFNALHWISVAFYDGFLSLHTRSLGLSNFVPGAAILVAVSAESIAFYFSRNLLERWRPEYWLLLVFPMGAFRWLMTALLTSKGWIISLQSLHFFSYGLWMVVMMIMLDRFAPKGQRIGVQGLFAATTFGIGGGIGQWAGGWLMQWAGGRGLYSVGAVLELLALAGLWFTFKQWQKPSPSLAQETMV